MATRSFKEFLIDITRKPLILFPLVALAHILWLLWIVGGNRHLPLYDTEWLQALWMLGFTIFWIAVCDYRKWGAIGYILLTLLDLILLFSIKNIDLRMAYTSPLLVIYLDCLFSFFILFFYKRFR